MRRPPRVDPSARLANRLVCDALASIAIRTRAGWLPKDHPGLPLVEIFDTRYALSGDLVDGKLYAIPAVRESRPALIAREGQIFPAGKSATGEPMAGGRVVAELAEVRYVTKRADVSFVLED